MITGSHHLFGFGDIHHQCTFSWIYLISHHRAWVTLLWSAFSSFWNQYLACAITNHQHAPSSLFLFYFILFIYFWILNCFRRKIECSGENLLMWIQGFNGFSMYWWRNGVAIMLMEMWGACIFNGKNMNSVNKWKCEAKFYELNHGIKWLFIR